jgi:drug/metabolite transporter (DMT)-like permease
MARPLVASLYAVIVVVWSSTWVAIKFGLEETPPLLGAGIRFALAGAALLLIARAAGRRLRTDALLAGTLALFPFAITYGLVYWSEQYIPSGLAAVLFGVMPIYVAFIAILALPDERIRTQLFAGIGVALAGLVLAFGESLALGDDERAALGALAGLLAPLAAAVGNVAIKRRGAGADPIVLNGWGMLAGGLLLLLASAPAERWEAAQWTGQAFAAIGYLAVLGSMVPFVILTILLRELPAVTMSYVPLLLPFGALAFGAGLYDEPLTLPALGGAALVAGGLLVAQWPGTGRLGWPPRGRSGPAPPPGA